MQRPLALIFTKERVGKGFPGTQFDGLPHRIWIGLDCDPRIRNCRFLGGSYAIRQPLRRARSTWLSCLLANDCDHDCRRLSLLHGNMAPVRHHALLDDRDGDIRSWKRESNARKHGTLKPRQLLPLLKGC